MSIRKGQKTEEDVQELEGAGLFSGAGQKTQLETKNKMLRTEQEQGVAR